MKFTLISIPSHPLYLLGFEISLLNYPWVYLKDIKLTISPFTTTDFNQLDTLMREVEFERLYNFRI